MIKLVNINKSFGSKVILENFNLHFEQGTMTAIVGNSGSGKSTLLNIIGLLEEHDSGKLYINSTQVEFDTKESMLVQRHNLSYLFQNFALVDNLTVEENLNIAQEYIKFNKSSKKARVDTVLKQVGLDGFEKRIIYTLSGGEQQRVALARVLLRESEIILCDEPTGSLDEDNGAIIMKLLKQLKEKGKTIVIVTHDMNIANQCDRTIKIS